MSFHDLMSNPHGDGLHKQSFSMSKGYALTNDENDLAKG